MFARLAVLIIAVSAGLGCTSQPDNTGAELRAKCESECQNVYCLSANERGECSDSCIEETQSSVTEYNRCARSASTCTETRDCARAHLYVELTEIDGSVNNQTTQTNNQSTQTNNQTTQSNNQTTQSNNQTTQSNNQTEPVCGNGIVEGDEECDDGNDDDTDSCVHCRHAEPDPQCPVPTEKFCDGMCRDWVSNPEHCGECDTFCSFGVCENGVCVDLTFCRGNKDCPPDERCDHHPTTFDLHCTEGERGTLAFGEPCSSNNDCETGICLNYCTRDCEFDGDCEPGWECSDAEWCQMKF